MLGTIASALAIAASAKSLFGKDKAQENFSNAQSFNADQADRERDFIREQMQNRHQWEVNDLRAAGLNPILSAMGQPPVHGGAMAVSPSPDYQKSDRVTRRLEFLSTTAKFLSEIDLNKAMKDKVEEEKKSTELDNELKGSKFGKIARALGMLTGPGLAAGAAASLFSGAFRGRSAKAARGAGFSASRRRRL